MTRKRKSTTTSIFGSPGRVNHDSSSFYAGKLYQELPKVGLQEERPPDGASIPDELLDKILCGSSEQMAELPDGSVHLMVTSPPYNVGKAYDQDLTLEDYRAFLKRVLTEVYRVLAEGGRACINVANLGRKPYIPLHAYIIEDMQAIGFQMRGEIIWNKASSASPSTAWGSWRSASNPTLRDVHEYILVFSKGSFRLERGPEKVSTISAEQFLEYTRSVWTFPAESARKVKHPAPFPLELPYRLIQLYTFGGDLVLDPFMGSGQTAIAARMSGRHFVGYEIDPQYVALAERRLQDQDGNAPGSNRSEPPSL